MSEQLLHVGIIGQGRSGRDIHGNLLAQLGDCYRIAAVADSLPQRQQRARQEFGCRAYAAWEDMVERETLDVVVNASPSDLHIPDRTPFDAQTEQFYRMLYRAITEGAPLEVTAQQVKRQMEVMEECRRQNPHIYKEDAS